MYIREMAIESWNIAESKGFHKTEEDRNVPTKLMLIVAEVAEALEDYRDGKIKTTIDKNGKPHGYAQELADVAIRLGDLAEMTGVDLEKEIIGKMAYNKTRPFKHGKKF